MNKFFIFAFLGVLFVAPMAQAQDEAAVKEEVKDQAAPEGDKKEEAAKDTTADTEAKTEKKHKKSKKGKKGKATHKKDASGYHGEHACLGVHCQLGCQNHYHFEKACCPEVKTEPCCAEVKTEPCCAEKKVECGCAEMKQGWDYECNKPCCYKEVAEAKPCCGHEHAHAHAHAHTHTA